MRTFLITVLMAALSGLYTGAAVAGTDNQSMPKAGSILLASATGKEGAGSEDKAGKKKEVAKNKVELFTTSWCGYCAMARKFLRDRKIEFIEYDIEKDEAAALRRQRLYGRGGVPLAVINGTAILGFSPDAYDEALKK